MAVFTFFANSTSAGKFIEIGNKAPEFSLVDDSGNEVRFIEFFTDKELWKAGLHVSAMVPCGNVGIYQEKEVTQISLLHPRFMHMIYPDPKKNFKQSLDKLPPCSTLFYVIK